MQNHMSPQSPHKACVKWPARATLGQSHPPRKPTHPNAALLAREN
jgi:hypothetical protein